MWFKDPEQLPRKKKNMQTLKIKQNICKHLESCHQGFTVWHAEISAFSGGVAGLQNTSM